MAILENCGSARCGQWFSVWSLIQNGHSFLPICLDSCIHDSRTHCCGAHRPMEMNELRLPLTAASSIDISSGVAGIVGRELNIDRSQFARLARSAERIVCAEVLEVFDRCATGYL